MRPALLLAATLLTAPLPAAAIEEPAFQLVQQDGSFELRRYAPYVVAEVTVQGSFNEAGNQAFRLLANYIFGGNQGERKLAMTAPVLQAPQPGMKMAMTAPVTQQTQSDGSQLVQFVLPAAITLTTAPLPTNPRVRLREEPARLVAVQRYSGGWSEAAYREQLELLQARVRAQGWTVRGEPQWARFNGPVSLPFLRRNEIWLTLEEASPTP